MTVWLPRFRAIKLQRLCFWAGCLSLSFLLGCGSSPRVKPADVGAVPNSLRLQTAWTFTSGTIDIPLAVNVQANGLALANGRGAVWALDLATGRESAITTAGGSLISEGMAEFIAQEEMDRQTGYWWAPERLALQTLIDHTQQSVNGWVRVKLYKGNVIVVSRDSKTDSLFDMNIATFDEDGGAYNQADAGGFIKLNALRMRIAANARIKRGQ